MPLLDPIRNLHRRVSWWIPYGTVGTFLLLLLAHNLVWSLILGVRPLLGTVFTGIIKLLLFIISKLFAIVISLYGSDKVNLACGPVTCGNNCNPYQIQDFAACKINGWYDWITGWVKSVAWWAFTIWIIWRFRYPLARLMSHVPFVGEFFKRWLERNPKKKYKRTWKTLKTYGIAPFKLWLRSKDSWYTKVITKVWKRMQNPYIDNTLPFAFRQLRAELMIHMNWMTRLHTYFGKMGAVEDSKKKVNAIEENFGSTPRTYTELSYVLDNERTGGLTIENGEESFGWGNNVILIDMVFEELKKDLEQPDEIWVDPGHEFWHGKSAALRAIFTQQIGIRMKRSWDQFMGDSYKFGLLHRLRSNKLHVLDLYCMHGVYKHTYRFAHEDSIFELWNYDDVRDITKHHEKAVVWSLNRDNLVNNASYEGYREYKIAVENARRLILKWKKREVFERLKAKHTMQVLTELSTRTNSGNVLPNAIKNRYTTSRIIQNTINLRVKAEFTSREIQNEIKYGVEAELTQRYVQEYIRKFLMGGRGTPPLLGTAEKPVWGIVGDPDLGVTGNPNYRLGFALEKPNSNFRHEIDVFGFVIADIHAIEVDRSDPPPHGHGKYIRRVRLEDFEDVPGPRGNKSTYLWSRVWTELYNEWGMFIDDLRFMNVHQNSRSDIDYTSLINSIKTFDLKNRTAGRFDEWITRVKGQSFITVGGEYPTRTPPQRPGRAGFDLDALRHSGLFKYWGRRNYWDELPELSPGNPFPSLSTVGLSRVLTALIERQEGQNENTYKFLSAWVYDNADEKAKQPVFTVYGATAAQNE